MESADVVFRAVSPHGHVYWEIEPKNLRHAPSADIYNNSRQSSSRYSDNHPLISSSTSDSTTGSTVLVNPFADVQLLPVQSATSSPLHRGLNTPEMSRFGSLRSGNSPASKLFTNRSNSARAAKMRDIARQIEQMRISQKSTSGGSTVSTNTGTGNNSNSGSGSTSPSTCNNVPEQLQQQIQIRDIKTINMPNNGHHLTTSDQFHILAKVQNVLNEDGANGSILNRNSPKQRKV